MDLTGYVKTNELSVLIRQAENNGQYYIDYCDNGYYSTVKMHWGTQLSYDSNVKVDGYLAHELLHADLNRQEFPNPKDFYDNTQIEILQNVIGPKSNCDLFNCIAHQIFHKNYINLGFNEFEFVANYNQDLIEIIDFETFVRYYDSRNRYLTKLYIEKFITIKTDFNSSRLTINTQRLDKLKNIHLDLFTCLDDFMNKASSATDISNINQIVTEFYEKANEICC